MLVPALRSLQYYLGRRAAESPWGDFEVRQKLENRLSQEPREARPPLIPDPFFHPLGAYLWRVALHSLIAAGLLYSWSRRLQLPSGRFRRRMHVLVLCLPLLTAALAGYGQLLFSGQIAIFDSHRILGVPLIFSLRVYHGVLMISVITVLLSLWQELLPLWNRARGQIAHVPDDLLDQVRELPGWQGCRVEIRECRDLQVATAGSLAKPRLILSRPALERFDDAELAAVLRHENAHWQRGRWRAAHLLYGIRLLQLYHPIALWVFREYVVETEIDCDRDAAASTGPRPLARALLAIYRCTKRSDVGSRSVLRTRIDVLTGEAPFDDEPIPDATLGLAFLILFLVLPWVV